jgi:hypothetical protein
VAEQEQISDCHKSHEKGEVAVLGRAWKGFESDCVTLTNISQGEVLIACASTTSTKGSL